MGYESNRVAEKAIKETREKIIQRRLAWKEFRGRVAGQGIDLSDLRDRNSLSPKRDADSLEYKRSVAGLIESVMNIYLHLKESDKKELLVDLTVQILNKNLDLNDISANLLMIEREVTRELVENGMAVSEDNVFMHSAHKKLRYLSLVVTFAQVKDLPK